MQKEDMEKIAIEKTPGSLVKMTGEIPFSYLEKHRAEAIKTVATDIEIDGFRKGHVPEKVLVGKVGEMTILREMAERALSHVYPKLVKMHELEVIGYPEISITKLAKDNPLGFSLTVAVVPEIELPDYMKVAKDINKNKESKEVTDKEVEKQIQDLMRQKVAYEKLQAKASKTEPEEQKEEDRQPLEKPEDIPLPELTDEYVKTLGKPGQFSNVEDFKKKIREHLAIQKAQDVDSRHRAKITDAIIEKSKVELPHVLIDAEIGQMFAQMEHDLKRAQLTMEDYLSHIKKTKEDLKKEWAPSAEKRAKLQLVLNEIAKREHVTADPERVKSEVDALMKQYKDADRGRVETYIRSALTNEEVLKKLEGA